MAKSHLVPDKSMAYYQLLTDFIDRKERQQTDKLPSFSILFEEFPIIPIADSEKKYRCFVIMPIGEKGTQQHKENMDVYERIIKQSVEKSGFNISCHHSDLIHEPGEISNQILNALHGDDIVIADLRRNNPNVIWELGIRHAFRKRCIMIYSDPKEAFFDTGHYRMARYHVDGQSNLQFFDRFSTFILHVIENPDFPDSPVSNWTPTDSGGTKNILEIKSVKENRLRFGYSDGPEGLRNVNGHLKFLLNNRAPKSNSIVDMKIECPRMADRIEIDHRPSTPLPFTIPAEDLKSIDVAFKIEKPKLDTPEAVAEKNFTVKVIFLDKFNQEHVTDLPFEFKTP